MTEYGVPDDADESVVPDADQVEDRADYPDPAFDDVDEAVEQPVDGEDPDEEPLLEDEPPELLEADEQVDPEETDSPTIPPEGEPDGEG